MNAYSPMSAALVKGLTAWEGRSVGVESCEVRTAALAVSLNALEHAELCPRARQRRSPAGVAGLGVPARALGASTRLLCGLVSQGTGLVHIDESGKLANI